MTLGYSRHLSTALIISSLLLASSTVAAETKNQPGHSDPNDLKTVTCKEVMRLSGEERWAALGVLHGYALAKKGTTVYVIDKLAQATDDFMDYCLDNPKAGALEAMLKFAK